MNVFEKSVVYDEYLEHLGYIVNFLICQGYLIKKIVYTIQQKKKRIYPLVGHNNEKRTDSSEHSLKGKVCPNSPRFWRKIATNKRTQY